MHILYTHFWTITYTDLARSTSCWQLAGKMWIVALAVMVASSFVFSSLAQSQPPSAECVSAYNATFDNLDGCSGAYFALFLGSATDEQRMMVCDAGQQCNTMIENIISLCGDTVRRGYVATHAYSYVHTYTVVSRS